MVLGVLSLVYNAFRIPIETEDVVKTILMLPGYRFYRAFIFDAFSLIMNNNNNNNTSYIAHLSITMISALRIKV